MWPDEENKWIPQAFQYPAWVGESSVRGRALTIADNRLRRVGYPFNRVLVYVRWARMIVAFINTVEFYFIIASVVSSTKRVKYQ